jgi:uncharacterized protein (TIGR03435 family)
MLSGFGKLVLLLVTTTLVATRLSQSTISFEVASIRQNRSGSANTNIRLLDGGRFQVVNATLKTLIRNAYDILGFQLVGGPSWLDTEHYDIEAKTQAPGELTKENLPKLLQSLLADRFRLNTHWETKDGSVYSLTVDRNGPKFGPSTSAADPGMNTSKRPGRAKMTGVRQPMSLLASNLGNQLGRYVLDQTGLRGEYDFSLEWDPDQTAESNLPSIFAALHESLGLKLEANRGPVPVLVIDRAEKPSQN